MSPTLIAALVLFNGQNLDGWKVLKGEWAVRDGALVCTAGPGAIRSSFESDHYTLRFGCTLPDKSRATVRVGAAFDGSGGKRLAIARLLRQSPGPRRDDGVASAEISVGAASPDRLSHAGRSSTKPADTGDDARGFIVFETPTAGIEFRGIEVREHDFEPLFDGQDLKRWEPVGKDNPNKPNWTFEHGTLRCGGRGGVWLRTKESYDDFIIRLEYWLPRAGNSGVYLHAPLEGRVSQIGQEIQLIDHGNWPGALKPSQWNGSIYGGRPPEIDVPAPSEEWNAMEILARGKRIRTIVNGVQIYDARLDENGKDAMLLKNPLATRRLTGFIGLQDHTGGPRFRNIRLRPLNDAQR